MTWPNETSQFVYVMEDQNTHLLKIGISLDPEFRADQVNRQFGSQARVIGILAVADAARTERFIHGMLEKNRVVGEWFEVAERQKNYLLAYCENPHRKRGTKTTAPPRNIRRPASGELQVLSSGSASLTLELIWTLKAVMEQHGVTQYALQKQSKLSVNTIKAISSGRTATADPQVLARLLNALRSITGQDIRLGDILEWREETA